MRVRDLDYRIKRLIKLESDFDKMTLPVKRSNPQIWREILTLRKQIEAEIVTPKV